MTKQDIDQFYNWGIDASKKVYIKDVVRVYSKYVKDFEKQYIQLMESEIQEIQSKYDFSEHKCAGCAANKRKEMEYKIDLVRSKYNYLKENFIKDTFNTYINTTINLLKSMTKEQFLKQTFELNDIYEFTVDKVGKPKKKTKESIFKVYEGSEPS